MLYVCGVEWWEGRVRGKKEAGRYPISDDGWVL